jgi:hypothetical protein
MFLEIAKVFVIVGGIAALSPLGLRVAAGAVGIAFGATAIAGIALVARGPDGPSPWRLFVRFVQPLLACAVMAAAALGVNGLLRAAGVEHNAIYLVAEIVAGAAAYVVAALVICRETSRDLLALLKKTLKRSDDN